MNCSFIQIKDISIFFISKFYWIWNIFCQKLSEEVIPGEKKIAIKFT